MNRQYEDLMRHIYETGDAKSDRTGTGTTSTFGYQMRFNLAHGFPLVTTKKVPFKLVVAELLWFLTGSTNNNDLTALGCHIWDEWARPDGDLGPIYGQQWRSWGKADGTGIDQISEAIRILRTDPDSRRIIVSAWNVADLPTMALSPCHALFQFYTSQMSVAERMAYAPADFMERESTGPEGDHEYLTAIGVPRLKLSCQLYQRSADVFLGVPFNIASYSLLTHMVAAQCNMGVGEFIWTGGDCHLYNNHTEQVEEQLGRVPYAFPKLVVKTAPDDIFGYALDDFDLDGYVHHPAIKAPVAV